MANNNQHSRSYAQNPPCNRSTDVFVQELGVIPLY